MAHCLTLITHRQLAGLLKSQAYRPVAAIRLSGNMVRGLLI